MLLLPSLRPAFDVVCNGECDEPFESLSSASRLIDRAKNVKFIISQKCFIKLQIFLFLGTCPAEKGTVDEEDES